MKDKEENINSPKVSIIIPAYNVSDYIRETLDVVAAQSYRPLECVIVDDCSTDDTYKQIADYVAADTSGVEFVLLKQAKNGGHSAARNRAIEVATGEYLYFLDADDLIPSDCISSHTDYAIRYNCDFTDANIAVSDGRHLFSVYDEIRFFDTPEDVINSFFGKKRIKVSACNKLLHRRLFSDGDLRFPEGMFYEDILWTFKLCNKARKYVAIPKFTYTYRMTPGSVTRTLEGDHARRRIDSYLRMLGMMSEVILAIPEENIRSKAIIWMNRVCSRSKYQVGKMKLPAAEKKKYFSEISKLMASMPKSSENSIYKVLNGMSYGMFGIFVVRPLNIIKKIKSR